VKIDHAAWKDDPKNHYGLPSTLEDITQPEIRVGKDGDGDYSEIVVPDIFGPGSIMVFATDMTVSRLL
jgi:glycogen debranching enzyme